MGWVTFPKACFFYIPDFKASLVCFVLLEVYKIIGGGHPFTNVAFFVDFRPLLWSFLRFHTNSRTPQLKLRSVLSSRIQDVALNL